MSLVTAKYPTYDVPKPSSEVTLQNECWYHGMITRTKAEALVTKEGDFLVRDSISHPGDYVLTVFWKGKALHFQINRTSSSNSRSSYNSFSFEDEQFDSVSDLILLYQSHRRPVTFASGCLILNPVSSKLSSSFLNECSKDLEENYARIFRPTNPKKGFERALSQQVLLNEARKQLSNTKCSNSASDLCRSTFKTKNHMPLSSLLNRPLPTPVKPSIKNDDQDEYCEMDYAAMDAVDAAECAKKDDVEILDASTSSLYRRPQHSSSSSLQCLPNVQKLSDSLHLTSSLTETSRSCQNLTTLNWRLPRVESVPSLPARRSSTPVRDSGCADCSDQTDPTDYDHPILSNCFQSTSLVDLINCRPPQLQSDSVPEATQLLNAFRSVLLNAPAEKCALSITQEDCRLLRLLKTSTRHSTNGLAQLLLPQGRPMREDLMERSLALQYTCIISILRAEPLDKVSMLSAWLNIARALLKLKNAFSFFSVMDALRSEALHSSAHLWHKLSDDDRSEFDNHLTVAAERLKTSGVLLVNNMMSSSPASCFIPFLQPLLDLFSSSSSTTYLDTSSLASQIESLWKWLEMGRKWALDAETYHCVAQNQFRCVPPSDKNLFSVEFGFRFLFGSQDYKKSSGLEKYQRLSSVVSNLARNLRS